jgi:hypothetical protein
MKFKLRTLSETRITRIREQGYFCESDQEINDLSFGNRFAYRLCTSLLIIGVSLANTYLLMFMMSIAFFAVMLPNHPFDYIYNILLAKRMNKPKLSRRSVQLKFSCSIATLMIAATIYFFESQMAIAGYITGFTLAGVATLLSLVDLCIPSKIFNALFIKKINTSITQ